MQNELNALLVDMNNILMATDTDQDCDINKITSFSSRVDSICSQIILLPVEERNNVLHLVKELLVLSDKLKNVLTAKKSALEKQIKSFNSLQKASSAYGKNSTK